jgi:hypothetical protein
MSTGFMQSSGTLDEKTHVMTEIGESILPAPAGTMKMKIVTKPVDDNQFLFTMYTLTPDGGEQKMMEITYTRAAGAEQPKAAATKADK